MTQIDKSKNMSVKKISIIAVIALAVIAAAVLCIVLAHNGYVATTMRLLRIEGTVTLENSKGGSKPVVDNMRFQSGDALSTGSDGLASVGLDDTKIITLQSDSRAEFSKKNKQLELKLTKGAVFFNVTEKLRSDESFEVKTSTMTAGIRGTSGIFYYDEADGGRESLIVTDGSVEISATNPKTGETKTARVEGGERIKLYLYSDKTEGSVSFEIDKVTEDDLSGFSLGLIANDDALTKRICDYTGWDPDKLRKRFRDIENSNPSKTTEPSESSTTGTTPLSSSSHSSTSEETSETTTASPTPTKRPRRKATKKPTKKPIWTSVRKPAKKPKQTSTTRNTTKSTSGTTTTTKKTTTTTTTSTSKTSTTAKPSGTSSTTSSETTTGTSRIADSIARIP